LSEWIDPARTDLCIDWARKTCVEMERFMAPSGYVNAWAMTTGDPVPPPCRPKFRRPPGAQNEVRPEQVLPRQPNHSHVL